MVIEKFKASCILIEICEHEKTFDDNVKDAVEKAEFVKKIRNGRAHSLSEYEGVDDPNKAKIVLWRKKTNLIRSKDCLKVDQELVD